MAETSKDRPLLERFGRLDSLLKDIEGYRDPAAQAHTREIVEVLMELHGSALERIFDRLASVSQGVSLIDKLAEDELVSGVMLLYGLHPLDFDARVRQAMSKVRQHVHEQGASIELLGVGKGLVRVRLCTPAGASGPSSAEALKQVVEAAIYEKAPDAATVEIHVEVQEGLPRDPHADVPRIALPVLAR